MSTTYQAEASKPPVGIATIQNGAATTQRKQMQECKRCLSAGFPNQPIAFEKNGQDPVSGKVFWKLVDENGMEHKHRTAPDLAAANVSLNTNAVTTYRRKRVIDLTAVTDLGEARRLLLLGWEYKTSYPATIANVPHYVLVKRE